MPHPPYIRDSQGSVRQGELISPTDSARLHLEPNDLTFIRVDHQTRLQFGQTEVVIHSPFTLRSSGGELLLDPDDRAALGPLLAEYPCSLVKGAVGPDCTLELLLSSGSVITVGADVHYEAWEILGPGTRLIVCPPGGGKLATWS